MNTGRLATFKVAVRATGEQTANSATANVSNDGYFAIHHRPLDVTSFLHANPARGSHPGIETAPRQTSPCRHSNLAAPCR